MKAESKQDMTALLNWAVENNSILICVLKEGLSQTCHLHLSNPVLYTKIEFRPNFYYDGYYSGPMFYPNGKSQGLREFDAASFESIVCLGEV